MFHVLSFQNHLNRVLLSSVFFILIVLVSSSQIQSQTVSNFGQWRTFNSLSKIAYTAGALDSFFNPLQVIEEHKRFKSQLRSCLKEFRITIGEIVSMIDEFYLNSNNWGYSPQDAIKYQLIEGHCSYYLAER
jgi:hypothetical protein